MRCSDVLFRHMRFHAREARVQREIGYRSDHREVCPVWEPKPHLRDESGSMTSPWSSGSSSVQLSLTGDPVYAQKRPVLPCWSGAYVNQVVTLDRPCTKQAYPPTTGIHWLRDNVTSTANLHNRLQGLLSQYFGDLDASAIFIQDCDKSQRDTESVAEDYQYPLNYGQRPWPQYE